MKQENISLRSRISSFAFAWNGIKQFCIQEANARIHFFASLLICIGIIGFKTSLAETIALLIVMGMVWVSEIFNTAVERIADLISTEYDARIGLIKDLAAGAVLLAAIVAAITGAIIFIPKIF